MEQLLVASRPGRPAGTAGPPDSVRGWYEVARPRFADGPVACCVVAGLLTEPLHSTAGLLRSSETMMCECMPEKVRETFGRPPRRGQETRAELGVRTFTHRLSRVARHASGNPGLRCVTPSAYNFLTRAMRDGLKGLDTVEISVLLHYLFSLSAQIRDIRFWSARKHPGCCGAAGVLEP
jgi:hypothetical protein